MLNKEEIEAFLAREFPQALELGFEIAAMEPTGVTLHLKVEERHLRPGGTVSGPVLMTLVDTSAYLSILGRLGEIGLAVTTDLQVHFLRRPTGPVIVAECELLKLGRRLAVAATRIHQTGDGALVAHGVTTYSLPPGTRG
ncbi:MAG: PaaI family thioesterase [Myxococcota bacterium]